MAFTTIKNYSSAQTATESAPVAALANFVTVPGLPRNQNLSRLIELRVNTPVFAGTVAATAITFNVWRLNKDDTTRDFLKAWTIQASDVTAGTIEPLMLETYGNELMVTLASFSGGTAPSFTGAFQGRAVE